jgi:hypothetical protein
MTLIRGLLISGCALVLALANGCGRTTGLGRSSSGGAGGVLATGGAGGMSAFGGSTATGGQGGVGTTGPCTDTLSAVAEKGFACPSDYASAQQWQAICSSGHGHLGSCNGFLALLFSTGEWGKECYYDSVSGALVGAVAQDDVPDYCNRTSYTIAGGSYPSDCPLSLLDDLGDCMPGTGGRGGQGGMGGTGGLAGAGGTTATVGQTACSSTKPCAQGPCVGASCGDTWTCVEDGRDCTGSLVDYCGCDGVTFLDSWACPASPFDHRGACGPVLANCDQRDVACNMLPPTCGPGQFPAVVGSCWDGTCVPLEQCLCTVMEECPAYSGQGYLEQNECCGSQHCCPLE